MHIIEPDKKARKSHQTRLPTARFIIYLVLAGIIILLTVNRPEDAQELKQNKVPDGQSMNSQKSGGLKTLSHGQFRDLYRTMAYPNIREIDTPPYITGSINADERIIEIAKKRGYKLTSVPVAPISKIDDKVWFGEELMQEKAYVAWRELKTEAQKQSINLTLVSAYRSIEMQRQLFLERLRASGATNEMIVSGRADNIITGVLQAAAPPGYSRHHTGYTIDLACGSVGSYAFLDTECYKWLSADNYKNAKLKGWIPSYPEGADLQGPEPEPWEYVWVGVQMLRL